MLLVVALKAHLYRLNLLANLGLSPEISFLLLARIFDKEFSIFHMLALFLFNDIVSLAPLGISVIAALPAYHYLKLYSSTIYHKSFNELILDYIVIILLYLHIKLILPWANFTYSQVVFSCFSTILLSPLLHALFYPLIRRVNELKRGS
jgi:hypothetical protein